MFTKCIEEIWWVWCSPVCRQYLRKYPVDVDLLWEVEGVGGPYQKVKVASKLGSLILQCKLLQWLCLGRVRHWPSNITFEIPAKMLAFLAVGFFSKNTSLYQCISHCSLQVTSHYQLNFTTTTVDLLVRY